MFLSGGKEWITQHCTTMIANCPCVTRNPLLVSKDTIRTSRYLASIQDPVMGIWYLYCSLLSSLEDTCLHHGWSCISSGLLGQMPCLENCRPREDLKWTLNSFHLVHNLIVSGVHNLIARCSPLRHSCKASSRDRLLWSWSFTEAMWGWWADPAAGHLCLSWHLSG